MKTRLYILAFSAVTLIFSVNILAHPSEYPLKKVLILYDQRVQEGTLADQPNALQFLLGHFHVDCKQMQENKYKKGDIGKYDVVFYMKLGPTATPDRILEDLYKATKTVCWMGSGFEDFTLKYPELGISVNGYKSDYAVISFRDGIYPRVSAPTAVVEGNAAWHADAFAINSDGETPVIMRRENFWYISGFPFYETEGYIFAEMLHDIMDEDHPAKKTAYLRLEDISSYYKPEDLYTVADLLKDKEVPYMMGIIPAYYDPDRKLNVKISDHPFLVEVLHYMQANGGVAVLHGYNHVSSETEETGEGYEFWDGDNDAPLEENSKEVFSAVILEALEECLINGIYPLAWESPHYASSVAGYEATALHFSMAVEQFQLSDRTCFSSVTAPYIIWEDPYGRTVIPENCGYVYEGNGSTYAMASAAIVRNAERLKIVRDATAVFFFHPRLDPQYLASVIDGIREEGYVFGDIRRLPCYVDAGNSVYRSGVGSLDIAGGGDYVKTYYLNRNFVEYGGSMSEEQVEGDFEFDGAPGPYEITVAERWVNKKSKRYTSSSSAKWIIFGKLVKIKPNEISGNFVSILIWLTVIIATASLFYFLFSYVTRSITRR